MRAAITIRALIAAARGAVHIGARHARHALGSMLRAHGGHALIFD